MKVTTDSFRDSLRFLFSVKTDLSLWCPFCCLNSVLLRHTQFKSSVFLLTQITDTSVATLSFAKSLENQWIKEKEFELPAEPRSVRVINEQIWCCCCSSGIIVFDSDLKKLESFAIEGTTWVNDVARMSNGQIVIADGTGLFHVDIVGEHATSKKLDYTYVSLMQCLGLNYELCPIKFEQIF